MYAVDRGPELRVPFMDLGPQQFDVGSDIADGFTRVISSSGFIGGPEVDGFEEAYARYIGAAHCVGVGNGTDAIELCLRAIGVGPGDEVIVPGNTFIATAEAVARTGARPVFVDVDDDYLLMDPDRLTDALTPRVRAVLPVHLYGQAAPLEVIAEVLRGTDVALIEDAAQAQGATRHGVCAGGLASLAATSFYPGKNLGAYGDAGAVLSQDEVLAGRVRAIAAHGSVVRYEHPLLGFNSRLDALQAVVLSAKLRHLPRWNEQRRVAAEVYDDLLAEVPGVVRPRVMPGNEHVWHLYVVRVEDRDGVLTDLQRAGVAAAVHYPTPLHLTGAFSGLGGRPGDLPVVERAAARILSLPMFPGITTPQQERVAETLRLAVAAR